MILPVGIFEPLLKLHEKRFVSLHKRSRPIRKSSAEQNVPGQRNIQVANCAHVSEPIAELSIKLQFIKCRASIREKEELPSACRTYTRVCFFEILNPTSFWTL